MDTTALRVILRQSSYAILGPGLGYPASAKASYVFTHNIPGHDPHQRLGEWRNTRAVAEQRVAITLNYKRLFYKISTF